MTEMGPFLTNNEINKKSENHCYINSVCMHDILNMNLRIMQTDCSKIPNTRVEFVTRQKQDGVEMLMLFEHCINFL